jgi:hypothetical protein
MEQHFHEVNDVYCGENWFAKYTECSGKIMHGFPTVDKWVNCGKYTVSVCFPSLITLKKRLPLYVKAEKLNLNFMWSI